MTQIPPKPKQPLNAFFRFSMENRNKIREQNPDMKVVDITRELQQKFQALPEETKAKYKKQYDEEMVIWKKKMEEYKNKYKDELANDEKKKK